MTETSSFTKFQIANAINPHICFRINVYSTYYIDYTADEYVTFDELEEIVARNYRIWQNLRINVKPGLEWENLSKRISSIREFFNSLSNIDIDGISYQIERILNESPRYEEGKKIFNIYISAPIDRDSQFAKIRDFTQYYLTVNEEYIDDAVRHFIELNKEPIKVGKSYSSTSPVYHFPALYLLRQDFSGYRETKEEIDTNLINPLSLRCKELESEVQKTSLELTDFTDKMYGKLQTNLDNKANEIEKIKEDIETWRTSEINKFKNFETAYKDKLTYEEPEKLWQERARWSTFMTFVWAAVAVGSACGMMYFAKELLQAFYDYPIHESELSAYISKSFILVALISFMIYMIRIIVKLVMSNSHLASECRQKMALTRFYRALLANGIDVNEQEKLIVLSALFSRIETGLVKTEASTDIEALLSVITRSTTGIK